MKSIASPQVPTPLLKGIIAMGLGQAPSQELWADLCQWADRNGGDVVIEFDPGDTRIPNTASGYRLNQLRFVSPR